MGKQLQDAMKVLRGSEWRPAYAAIAWDALSQGEREQLNQLLHCGPVWDGSVLSKTDRDTLLDCGLATRCCFQGSQGYTAATYRALTVFKAGNAKPRAPKAGTQG